MSTASTHDHGSPARSVNHPCEPDCAIYTVSYSDADAAAYDVAFFAIKDLWNAADIYVLDAENDDEISSSSTKRLSGLDLVSARLGDQLITSKNVISHSSQAIVDEMARLHVGRSATTF